MLFLIYTIPQTQKTAVLSISGGWTTFGTPIKCRKIAYCSFVRIKHAVLCAVGRVSLAVLHNCPEVVCERWLILKNLISTFHCCDVLAKPFTVFFAYSSTQSACIISMHILLWEISYIENNGLRATRNISKLLRWFISCNISQEIYIKQSMN